jgi:hypothetical protein
VSTGGPPASLPEARQAIPDALHAYALLDGLTDGQYIGDWAVVAHIAHFDDPSIAHYLVTYPSDYLPRHIAIGLFAAAAETIDEDPT